MRIALAAATAAAVAALVVLVLVVRDDPSPRPATERCDPGDLPCYERGYTQQVRAGGPERAFKSFKADYNRDPIARARCHRLAHAIGNAAGKRFRDVEEAYRRGDRFCASGYYHGVLEAIVPGAVRAAAVRRPDEICRGLRGESVDQGNCAHGLGHGFMEVRSNDVPASLRLCDRLSADYQRGNCYDGVFMENVMSEDDPDHPSRYLDRNRPLRLCSVLPDRYRASCLDRQVLYALEVTRGDFRTMFALCRQLGSGARPQCDRQLGEAAADLNIMSQPDASVQAGATAQLCALAPDAEAKLRCVDGATGYFVFHYDRTAEAKAFCRVLGPLRRRCEEAADQHLRNARND